MMWRKPGRAALCIYDVLFPFPIDSLPLDLQLFLALMVVYRLVKAVPRVLCGPYLNDLVGFL